MTFGCCRRRVAGMGMSHSVVVLGFPEGPPEAVAVPDEEVDEGCGEASLHHQGPAAFGRRLEVGHQAGDPGGPRFVLPWKGHQTIRRRSDWAELMS